MGVVTHTGAVLITGMSGDAVTILEQSRIHQTLPASRTCDLALRLRRVDDWRHG